MKLLCLGDIAISNPNSTSAPWPVPGDFVPGKNSKILFNWELPSGTHLNPTPRPEGAPRLLSSPASPALLSKWAPGFAAMATNHVLDAGEDGLADTLTALRGAGFETVGAGTTLEEITRPLYWETPQGRLAIINWVFPETHPDWMSVPGPNCWPGIETAQMAIHKLKQEVDWVMVLAHWSDEYFPYPRSEDRLVARQLAKAGADILVSHHPHVVRGMEFFGSCPVFYSLGNFYFSESRKGPGRPAVKWAPRNHEGLGVLISFKYGLKPEFELLSFWQKKEQAILDSHERAYRRMVQTSQPLKRYKGESYSRWYAARREKFFRWEAKWHFGVRRLGIFGSIQYLERKLISRLRGEQEYST